eukprot:m.6509 g.6509  ORF g.6509 m.6509 type:complete len:333 (-) comp2628_c0_seq1:295-1293(-)
MAAPLTIRPVSGKTTVVVHPLVLLSVVDHYNRACANTSNRAVGILLGSWKKGNILDVANSFAVPFEEDAKNKGVWFLDHDYLERLFAMFRKVNARERIVGWYHTGPKLRANDIAINELVRRFVAHPILVIVDANKQQGLPTQAYVSVEEVHEDGTPTSRTFEHVASEIGAEEAEEVGVEHLLRDVKDIGESGTLSHRIQNQLGSLKGLKQHLQEIKDYLDAVVEGKLPINHQISYLLQDVFNLLPNLDLEEFSRSISSKISDSMLVVYLSTLLRATIALHNLINNQMENLRAEQREQSKADKEEADAKKQEEKDASAEKSADKEEADKASKA